MEVKNHFDRVNVTSVHFVPRTTIIGNNWRITFVHIMTRREMHNARFALKVKNNEKYRKILKSLNINFI